MLNIQSNIDKLIASLQAVSFNSNPTMYDGDLVLTPPYREDQQLVEFLYNEDGRCLNDNFIDIDAACAAYDAYEKWGIDLRDAYGSIYAVRRPGKPVTLSVAYAESFEQYIRLVDLGTIPFKQLKTMTKLEQLKFHLGIEIDTECYCGNENEYECSCQVGKLMYDIKRLEKIDLLRISNKIGFNGNYYSSMLSYLQSCASKNTLDDGDLINGIYAMMLFGETTDRSYSYRYMEAMRFPYRVAGEIADDWYSKVREFTDEYEDNDLINFADLIGWRVNGIKVWETWLKPAILKNELVSLLMVRIYSCNDQELLELKAKTGFSFEKLLSYFYTKYVTYANEESLPSEVVMAAKQHLLSHNKFYKLRMLFDAYENLDESTIAIPEGVIALPEGWIDAPKGWKAKLVGGLTVENLFANYKENSSSGFCCMRFGNDAESTLWLTALHPAAKQMLIYQGNTLRYTMAIFSTLNSSTGEPVLVADSVEGEAWVSGSAAVIKEILEKLYLELGMSNAVMGGNDRYGRTADFHKELELCHSRTKSMKLKLKFLEKFYEGLVADMPHFYGFDVQTGGDPDNFPLFSTEVVFNPYVNVETYLDDGGYIKSQYIELFIKRDLDMSGIDDKFLYINHEDLFRGEVRLGMTILYTLYEKLRWPLGSQDKRVRDAIMMAVDNADSNHRAQKLFIMYNMVCDADSQYEIDFIRSEIADNYRDIHGSDLLKDYYQREIDKFCVRRSISHEKLDELLSNEKLMNMIHASSTLARETLIEALKFYVVNDTLSKNDYSNIEHYTHPDCIWFIENFYTLTNLNSMWLRDSIPYNPHIHIYTQDWLEEYWTANMVPADE